MNICIEYAALLDPFVDGELPPEEMIRVQEHLDECPACRAYVDDALAIRAAFPDAEDTEVPEGFAESVSAAIRAGAAPRKRKAALWTRTVLPLAACCAIVILLARAPIAARSGGGSDGAAPVMETSEGAEPAADNTALEAAEESVSQEPQASAEEDGVQAYADLPAFTGRETGPEEAVKNRSADLYSQADVSSQETPGPAPAQAAPEGTGEDGGVPVPQAVEAGEADEDSEGWVEYGNVVFAAVVYLSRDEAGDALAGYEGRPYRHFNHPDDGVLGTGYALEQEDFERILEELGRPFQNPLDQYRTTELRCIVVMD